jgi:hypothetical protein
MEYGCQRVLGPRCGVKITFDPRDGGSFILCNEAFILDHSHVIVNGKYHMSFTRYHYVALYDDDDKNEGCTVQFQHIRHRIAI